MKQLSIKFYLFALSLFNAYGTEVTFDYLDKVAVIESNQNIKAVGDKGKSRGAFQLSRGAFNDAYNYSLTINKGMNDIPLPDKTYEVIVSDYEGSKAFAYWYFKWLEVRMIRCGYTPTKLSLYMAYNCGFETAKKWGFDPNAKYLPYQIKHNLIRAELILNK